VVLARWGARAGSVRLLPRSPRRQRPSSPGARKDRRPPASYPGGQACMVRKAGCAGGADGDLGAGGAGGICRGGGAAGGEGKPGRWGCKEEGREHCGQVAAAHRLQQARRRAGVVAAGRAAENNQAQDLRRSCTEQDEQARIRAHGATGCANTAAGDKVRVEHCRPARRGLVLHLGGSPRCWFQWQPGHEQVAAVAGGCIAGARPPGGRRRRGRRRRRKRKRRQSRGGY